MWCHGGLCRLSVCEALDANLDLAPPLADAEAEEERDPEPWAQACSWPSPYDSVDYSSLVYGVMHAILFSEVRF